MLIQHKQTGDRGMFYVEEDGNILAEIIYSNPDINRMIIEHTEVDDELRGQNVGFQLVCHTVEHARTHNMKITPVCTFAKSVFDKKPDFKDVLAI